MKVVKEVYELMGLITVSWALLLGFFFGMKMLLYCTEGLPFRSMVRGVGGAFLLLIWASLFFLLRNLYAKAKGVPIPILPFSSRTRRGRRRA